MKFLVVRFSSIGDIVLTFPVVDALKEKYSNAEIHYISKKENATLLKACQAIDKTFFIDKNIFEVLAELKNEKYDYVIDLHKNLRTQTLKNFLRVRSFSYPKLNFKKWLYVQLKLDFLGEKHVVERYFMALKKLNIAYNSNKLNFHIPDQFQLELSQYGITEKKYNCIVLGAKYATKKLPLSKLLPIVEKFKENLVLLGGKEEEEIANEIVKANPKNKIVNLVGKLNIIESAFVLKYAKTILTNDTGLMHIASSFDCKIIVTWGNTTPKFGMYPYAKKESKVVDFEVEQLRCRPCSKIGYSKCPKRHFSCMNDLDEAKILEAFCED